MKSTRLALFLFGFSIGSQALLAQDVHFSQMSASPLTLNPALAGAHGSLQATLNFRSQWNSVDAPFRTVAGSFDMRINERKRTKKGHLAMGINFYNDQSGDAKVTTNTGSLNVAYHILLDKKSTFGAGLYTGIGQRAIDSRTGMWGSQYNGMNYDPTLSSGEFFYNDQFMYFDAGAGLVYTFKNSEGYMTQNNQREWNAGLAVYHLNRPKYGFINDYDDRLYMRWSLFVNGVIGISNTRWSVMPALYYQRQKTAQEILIGTYGRYLISEASKVTGYKKGSYMSLGMFYRNKDAMVAKAMLEWDNLAVGFAYDFNVSGLRTVSKAKGGFEIALRYLITGDYLWSTMRFR